MDAEHALRQLREGNARFAAGEPKRPNQSAERRAGLVAGQQPWAMVLTCADSRVVPELIFDVGLGDLFVARVAGNVASIGILASLEFGASELDCPLLVVLGHHGCGAAQATLDRGHDHPGVVSELTRRMAAACVAMHELGDMEVNELVDRNVRRQVEELRSTPPTLSERVGDGRLSIVGAVYELATGRVHFLDA